MAIKHLNVISCFNTHDSCDSTFDVLLYYFQSIYLIHDNQIAFGNHFFLNIYTKCILRYMCI